VIGGTLLREQPAGAYEAAHGATAATEAS